MSALPAETTTTIEQGLGRAVEVFQSHRTRLFRIAFRVTEDWSLAEDVVQEAWLRWQFTDRAAIQNPAAFLTTATTRLAINLIQSARHRLEAPTSSPLAALVDPGPDPAAHAEQLAAIEQTLAVLMTRLSPTELAAYVLRKGFDYAYGDLAVLLRTSVPNSRQLVRRAQLHIDSGQERAVDPEEHRLLSAAFLRAGRSGDLPSLEQALVRRYACDGCTVLPIRRDG